MGEKNMVVLTEDLIDKKLAEITAKNKAEPREYMTFVEFREKVADWSETTLLRRIKDENFPAIKDKGGYLIPREEYKNWFKKRKV